MRPASTPAVVVAGALTAVVTACAALLWAAAVGNPALVWLGPPAGDPWRAAGADALAALPPVVAAGVAAAVLWWSRRAHRRLRAPAALLVVALPATAAVLALPWRPAASTAVGLGVAIGVALPLLRRGGAWRTAAVGGLVAVAVIALLTAGAYSAGGQALDAMFVLAFGATVLALRHPAPLPPHPARADR